MFEDFERFCYNIIEVIMTIHAGFLDFGVFIKITLTSRETRIQTE